MASIFGAIPMYLLKSASLNLKVKANAKSNAVNDFITVNDKLYLKLSIKAIPERGKANEEIINYLAKEWQLNRRNLEIVKGHTNNLKTLLIKNIEQDHLNFLLSHYIK